MNYLAAQFFQNPFLGLTFGAACGELVVLTPTPGVFAAFGIPGTLLYLLLEAHTTATGGYFGAKAIAWFACCGLVSVVLLLGRAAGFGRSNWGSIPHARVLVAIFLIVVALEAMNGKFLHMTSTSLPNTWDHALALLDTRFGGNPAFFVGRVLQRHPWALDFAFIVYNGLLLGLISLMAIQSRQATSESVATFFQFAIAGIIGACLYFLFPAAGPRYAFPFFPVPDPALTLADLSPTAVMPAPRNGMPSLHTAWVVLMFLRSRYTSTLTTVCFCLLMVGTLLATLGQGEHYLIDLIVAIPLAAGISLLNTAEIRRVDWIAGGLLIAVAVLWVLALPALANALYLESFLLPGLSLMTVAGSLYVRSHFARPPNPGWRTFA